MKDNHINYVEFKAQDLEKVRKFYRQCFGWEFTDYGPAIRIWDFGFRIWDLIYSSQLLSFQSNCRSFYGR